MVKEGDFAQLVDQRPIKIFQALINPCSGQALQPLFKPRNVVAQPVDIV